MTSYMYVNLHAHYMNEHDVLHLFHHFARQLVVNYNDTSIWYEFAYMRCACHLIVICLLTIISIFELCRVRR